MWETVCPEVARVYRAGLIATGKPTKAVEEHFGVPRSTAIRWLRKTRDLGMLPPSTPGRVTGLHIARTKRVRVCEICGQLWPCDSAGEEDE